MKTKSTRPAPSCNHFIVKKAAPSWSVGLVILFFFVGTSATQAVPVSVYGVGHTTSAGLASDLYRFSENGTMEQKWDIPETYFGLSLATTGADLYVAGYGGAIDRYDLDGNFLGQFADVSTAGVELNVPAIETDAAGSLYMTIDGVFRNSPPTVAVTKVLRFDQDGNVSETFSHEDLEFPRGIDASANGDVYVLNSVGIGVGNRLFKFDSSGSYINDFSILETTHPADIALDEIREKLYITDESGHAIHRYDISSGTPIFSDTISVPGQAWDVFIEPITGRVFGTFYTIENKLEDGFLDFTGFEISPDGNVAHLYVDETMPRNQATISIVAIAIPEPNAISLLLLAMPMMLSRCFRMASIA